MSTELGARTGKPRPPESNEPGTLHEALDLQARQTPDATAVVAGTDRLSYRELADRSGRLAASLRAHGVRRGELVGLIAGRDLDTVIGMLAILKAGAGYVPLDPDYPVERLRFIIGDATCGGWWSPVPSFLRLWASTVRRSAWTRSASCPAHRCR